VFYSRGERARPIVNVLLERHILSGKAWRRISAKVTSEDM
jgi:hypothetical protein